MTEASAPHLTRVQDGQEAVLLSRTVIGRRLDCDLCLSEANVSTVHAAMRWSDGAWTIRDLASRNGVLVNGERISTGADVVVFQGDELTFGAGNTWVVTFAGPPVAVALQLGGREPRVARRGLLVMGPDDSAVSIYQDHRSGWVAERGSVVERLCDGQVITVEGEEWVLRLPTGPPHTHRDEQPPPCIDSVGLTLAVSLDEESVEAWATHAGRRIDLGTRSFLYLMVPLAAVRAEDADAGLPPAEQGWVQVEDLMQMMHATENSVNVSIHRLRRLFAERGIDDAARIIERRAYRRQVRLGAERVSVVRDR